VLMNNLKREARKISLMTTARHVEHLEQIYAGLAVMEAEPMGGNAALNMGEQLDLRMLGIRVAQESLDQPGVNWDDAV
jgi:hypothetical protein